MSSSPPNRSSESNTESQRSSRRVARRSESRRPTDNTTGDEGIDDAGFSGQGAQKEGDMSDAEGTGYTNDGSSDESLREDNSMSGSQGRHGKSGSRHGGVDRSVM